MANNPLESIGNTITNWLGLSLPKAESILTPYAQTRLATINPKLSSEISQITGTVPPKATTQEMIDGYLKVGANFINSIAGIASQVKAASTDTMSTVTPKVVTVGSAVSGSYTPAQSPQVNLPDNVVVLPGQTTTQATQQTQPAQDWSWIMWLIIALLVIAGVYVITKGK